MALVENYHLHPVENIKINGRDVGIVKPAEGKANGKWILKTEYFTAFPQAELMLLEKGYHIAHSYTKTRWFCEEDNKAKADLAEYMHNELGLSRRCAIVGMSCGGLQGIYFGAEYPEYVSCMYLDAPVVNFLSIPFGLGKTAGCESNAPMAREFTNATGLTLIDLLSYRKMPLDYIPKLISHKIPLILVSGDADTVVEYQENGVFLQKAYEATDIPFELHIKPGGDHHPHGIPDNNQAIVDFILKYDR